MNAISLNNEKNGGVSSSALGCTEGEELRSKADTADNQVACSPIENNLQKIKPNGAVMGFRTCGFRRREYIGLTLGARKPNERSDREVIPCEN